MKLVFLVGSLVALVVSVVIINEALSSENVSHDRWIQREDTVEIKSCLSPELLDEEKDSCRFYAVVIDAGSTGTRLHLFEFSHDLNKNSVPFQVEKETFNEVKPGLSGFSSNPKDAAKSVSELLALAKAYIPKSQWKRTPITLKATAGLRLLPDNQADAILEKVANEIASSGFIMDDNAVEIMSGTDEGIFSWFTLNVLIDRMKLIAPQSSFECDNSEPKPTRPEGTRMAAAALDLGGGSTQITFVPTDPMRVFAGTERKHFSHEVNVFGNVVQLYTHSYLGNGLVAARLGISQSSRLSQNNSLFTYCFPSGFSIEDWDYGGVKWKVAGSQQSSFVECLRSAHEYIIKTNVKQVSELKGHDIYAFSYFYDRGVQGGLIAQTDDNRGGLTTVEAFRNAAVQACGRSAEEIGPQHWQPWQCLDLTYIYVLLRHGYGLNDGKKIFLAKRLKNMEMSWALGASFKLLHSYHQKTASTENSKRNVPKKSAEGNTISLLKEIFMLVAAHATNVLSFLKLIS